jgi:hypothetical protein
LQSEVEKLSLEEQRLDDKIRLYDCFALQKEGILLFLYCWLMLSNYYYIINREMQEKLRSLSEDENNQK